MSELPAAGAYPIHFLTGVSYAHSAGEQERWQSVHDKAVARLLASLKMEPLPKSPALLEFIRHNPFMMGSDGR